MDHWLANHVFTLLFLFYGQQEVESDRNKVIWVSDVQSFDTLIQRNGYSKLLKYVFERRKKTKFPILKKIDSDFRDSLVHPVQMRKLR